MLTGLLHGFIKELMRFLLFILIPLEYTGKYCLETPVLITHFQYVLKYAQNFKGTVLSFILAEITYHR